MMIGTAMACPGALMFAFMLLIFTAVGAQAECNGEDQNKIKSCTSKSIVGFIKENNDTCNEESFSDDFCSDLNKFSGCITDKEISAACWKAGVAKIINSACKVGQYMEKCNDADFTKSDAESMPRASLIPLPVFIIHLVLMSI